MLELGCGSGQFAFYLHRKLRRLWPGALLYRLTDQAARVVEELRQHPFWQSTLSRGEVTIEALDLETDFRADGAKVIVANYVLDELPQQPDGHRYRPVAASKLLERLLDRDRLVLLSGKLLRDSSQWNDLVGLPETQHGETVSRPTDVAQLDPGPAKKSWLHRRTDPRFESLALGPPEFQAPQFGWTALTMTETWERLKASASLEALLAFAELVEPFPQLLWELLKGPSVKALHNDLQPQLSRLLMQSLALGYTLPPYERHRKLVAHWLHRCSALEAACRIYQQLELDDKQKESFALARQGVERGLDRRPAGEPTPLAPLLKYLKSSQLEADQRALTELRLYYDL